MDKIRLRTQLVRFALAMIGSAGIVRVYTSCVKVQIPASVIGLSLLLFCELTFGIVNKNRIVRRICGAVLLAFFVLALLNVKAIYQGFVIYINAAIEVISERNQIDAQQFLLPQAQLEIYQTGLAQIAAMLVFLLVIAFLTTIVVVLLQSMAAAVIVIAPWMAVFISFSVIPDTASFIMCVIFVFGVMATGKKEQKKDAALAVIAIATTLTVLILICFPQKEYVRWNGFVKAGQVAESVVNRVTGLIIGSNITGGALNSGELGQVDRVEYNNQTVLSVTTANTGKNQYIAEFYGQYYEDNEWSKVEYGTNSTNITARLFSMMDASQGMQDYIDGGTNTYYSITQHFKLITTNRVGHSTIIDSYNVDLSSYDKFKQIADGASSFAVQMNSSNSTDYPITQQYFIGVENKLRSSIMEDYLSVPDDIRELIVGMMGNITVSTQEQKEAYIERVKEYLQSNYTYSSHPGRVPDGEDFIEYFLTDSKQGYCTYFATAATVMLRCAGIPARYVEGYVVTSSQVENGQQGTATQERTLSDGTAFDQTYETYTVDVMDNQAHAWVEVYMDGYGWVPVEMTPGTSDNTNFLANTSEDTQSQVTGEEQTQPVDEEPTQQETTSVNNEAQQESTVDENGISTDLDNESSGKTGLGINVVAFVLVLFGFLLFVVIIRYHTKKKRRISLFSTGQQDHPADIILLQYRYLERLLLASGYGRPGQISEEAYGSYLIEQNPLFLQYRVADVIATVERASFGKKENMTQEDVTFVATSILHIRKDLIAQSKGIKRLLIVYLYGL